VDELAPPALPTFWPSLTMLFAHAGAMRAAVPAKAVRAKKVATVWRFMFLTSSQAGLMNGCWLKQTNLSAYINP
jgi:hypothetical protein